MIRRRVMVGVLLLGLCWSPLLSLVSGSGDQPDASAPYRIREASSSAGSGTPELVEFRGALYVRHDAAMEACDENVIPAYTRAWWGCLIGSTLCVSLAALAAGLTVGLVSIDPFDLALIQATEEGDCSTVDEVIELREEKKYADLLMPLVTRHHLLLVTLLICNAFSNELLPLLLDRLVPSWLAVLLSMTFVLIFGEIVPSSIFTGPNQMRYAAALSPLVWFMEAALFVIAWPIAWILDNTLGVEDEGRMRRSELKSLIRMQANSGGSDSNIAPSPTSEAEIAAYEHENGVLSVAEMRILHGALEMKDKRIREAMVPIDEAFMLPLDAVLDIDMLATILHHGHSRIPVYDGDRHNIRGVLLVKRLIVLNPEDRRPVKSIACRWPLICSPDLGLLSLMNSFQEGRSHMAIVCDKPTVMMAALRAEMPVPDECKIIGLITIEDIMELLIKEEISDEKDIGVRAALEHTNVVRKRIQRLKVLAAAARGPVPPLSRAASIRHMRSPSIGRAPATDALVRRLSITAANSPLLTSATSSPAPPSMSDYGYQASSMASGVAELKLDVSSPIPPHPSASLAVMEAPSASASPATAGRYVLQPTESQSRLLRDDVFTRAARSPLQVRGAVAVEGGLASFVPPPPTPTSALAAAASAGLAPGANAGQSLPPISGHQRSSSILTPRVRFTSDALTRRDLDSSTIEVLKKMGENDARAPHRTLSRAPSLASIQSTPSTETSALLQDQGRSKSQR